jgi:hypothetical protein
MAFNQGLAPFSWNPSSRNVMGTNAPVPGTPIPGGQVRAGDWCQVLVSYRRGSATPVVATPNLFLIHVVYTPNSDDATPHEDQMVTYGGTASNRRRNYHIDLGVTFQVPFDGQLSIIAGGDSDPALSVDVLLNRAFRPRDSLKEQLHQQAEVIRQVEELADISAFGASLQEPSGHDVRSLGPTGLYPPPVVGTPQMVPSTWINIANTDNVPFPDGAQMIEAVNGTGVPGSPIRFAVTALGAALSLDVASGIRRSIGTLGQGGATTDGTPATWQPNVALASCTIWSSLGG